MNRRKLWRVTAGWVNGRDIDPSATQRPESRIKAYTIHVRNNQAAGVHDQSQVWVDERDGRGWQLYETITHPKGVTHP